MQARPGDIPLQQVALRRIPGLPWLFAASMATAAIIAVGAGLVLGILAALQTGYGLDRWTQTVEAHGRLQLFGFATVFIMALVLEFTVRMNGRPPFRPLLRLGAPAAIAGGSVLQATGTLWYGPLGWLAPVGALILTVGAMAFALAVVRLKPPVSLRLDPQPWFIRLSAVWLVVASLMSLAAAFNSQDGMLLPVESHAIAEVLLRGFILQIIFAIGPRVLRGHLGLPALSARQQIVLLVALNLSTLAWLAAQDIWWLPGISWIVRLADMTLAASLIALSIWLRVFRQMSARYKGEPYEWQVPIAWFGLLIYAITLFAVRLVDGPGDLNLYQDGAIRHILFLGFMVPLMVAMSQVVLARFGTGRVHGERLLTTAFIVLVVSWPFRVVPALTENGPGDFGRGLMALAGAATMVALALVAIVCLRTALAVSRPVKQVLRFSP